MLKLVEVKFLKRLWTSQTTICPKCGKAELEHLHKKAPRMGANYVIEFIYKEF